MGIRGRKRSLRPSGVPCVPRASPGKTTSSATVRCTPTSRSSSTALCATASSRARTTSSTTRKRRTDYCSDCETHALKVIAYFGSFSFQKLEGENI
ncbi:hypothetical protein CDAR_407591 [Caerostris darwini]|uniref:Uncharacterized protein n=1 Tax=Caerostris darwini TaxID=1538125 RepID=A0AAV4Q1T0_9ARAC|nr:hypothetical protein CDAR_407591 [Caerostris darwini]